MMQPTYVCPKCGLVACGQTKKDNTYICMICGCEVVKLEPEIDWNNIYMLPYSERDKYNLKLQPQEQYDQMAWLHRVHVMQGRELECWHPQFDYRYKPGVILPECPYCHQYWTEKIKTSSRLLSAGIFGLGSKKIGKQWHCYFCDSDF